MNISNLQNKKYLLIVLSIVIIFLSYLLFFKSFGKVDDWKYTYSSPEKYLIGGAVIGGIIIIGWIILSIYLIVNGKPLINRDASKTRNPKRVMGIFLLAGPLLLLLISFISINYNFEIILFSVPILLLIFLISGIVYSIRNKIKVAIIPLVIVPIAIIGLGGFVMLFSGSFGGAMYKSISAVSSMAESANIGFSTGGAKDINNFKKNIENNYLPLPTDITYEGLFYDYYFDTGEKEVCTKLFCPSYNYAISKDPFSKEDEYYLSVGLNSGIKEADFNRKKLNLVVVLDISGSMSSAFNSYYYDQFGKGQFFENADNDTDNQKSKMQVATKSVVALLNHLNIDDRFGMVLYDQSAYLGKPLSLIAETDMDKIKEHILDISPGGSTNFEAGYKMGTGLFDEYLNADPTEYENRIIFLTDAMPNTGDISEDGLFGLTKKNAEQKIYTTFIGIGVDFNTELIEYITKIRGANYYSVHSSAEFKNRMDDEFEYMVTPLVFNLNLNLDAEGYKIEKVYGSPEANEATGEIMKVNTLFPSKKEDKETKGGIVILKLKKISPNADLKLRVSYEDRLGNVDTNEVAVKLESKTSDFYENTGIRKGILLSRYADLMKNWINDERESYTKQQPIKPAVNKIEGIVIPPDFEELSLGKWERQSIPLKVSQEYKDLIKEFKIYFESEMNVIGDNTLSKEITVMNKLTK